MGLRVSVSVLLLTITLGFFQHCGVFKAMQEQVTVASIIPDDELPPTVTIDTNPIVLLTTATSFVVSGACDLKSFTTGYRFEVSYRPNGITQTRYQLFNAECLDRRYSLTIVLSALGISPNVAGTLGVKIVIPRSNGDIVGPTANTNISWTCQLSCSPTRACGSTADTCGGNSCAPQTAQPPCPVCPATRTCRDPSTFCGDPNPVDTAGCNPTPCPRGTACTPECTIPTRTCTDPSTFCGAPTPADTGGCNPQACPTGTACCAPTRTCADPSTFCGDPAIPDTGGCNPTACARGTACGQACNVTGLPRGSTNTLTTDLNACEAFAEGRAAAFCQGGYTCSELYYPGGTFDLSWQFAGGGAGTHRSYGCAEPASDAPCAPQFLCTVYGLPRGIATKNTTSLAACEAFAESQAAGFCQNGFTCSELPPGATFNMSWTWNGQSGSHNSYGCAEARSDAPCTGGQACLITGLPRGTITRYTSDFGNCGTIAETQAAQFCQNGYLCSELTYPGGTFNLAWTYQGEVGTHNSYGCAERPTNYPCNAAQTCTVYGLPRGTQTSSVYSIEECRDFAESQAAGFCQSGITCEELQPNATFNMTWTWGGQTGSHNSYGCAETRTNAPCRKTCTATGIPGGNQTSQVETDLQCEAFAESRAAAFCQSGQLSCTTFPPGSSFNLNWSLEDGGSGNHNNYECAEERTNPPCAPGTQACNVSGIPGGTSPSDVQTLGECEAYAESKAAEFCQSGQLSCTTFPPGSTFNLTWSWNGDSGSHNSYGCAEERTNPPCGPTTYTCSVGGIPNGSHSTSVASMAECTSYAESQAAGFCQGGYTCEQLPQGNTFDVNWSWNGENDSHNSYGCAETCQE